MAYHARASAKDRAEVALPKNHGEMNPTLQTRVGIGRVGVQRTSVAPVSMLQRKCACGGSADVTGECEECRNDRLAVHRRAASPAPSIAPPIVYEALRSSGEPLHAKTRAFIEPRLGRDFSRVRVHADAKALESANAVNAPGYTVGSHITFGSGRYAPWTMEGGEQLAHEFTHFARRMRGDDGPSADPQIAGLNSRAESELERVSELAEGALVARTRPAILARQPEPEGASHLPQPGNDALSVGSATAAGPQIPTCNMQAVGQWIADPEKPRAELHGVTELAAAGGTQPDFRLRAAPGGKGFAVLPTTASLPPIKSRFLRPGRYLDRSMLNFRPQVGSAFPPRPGGYLNILEVTQDGSARLQAAEQEHCDDFRLAFYLSLYRFAEIVNDMARGGAAFSSESAARVALAAQTKVDPANLLAYFKCVSTWMRNERDGKNWHTPRVPPVDSIAYYSSIGDDVAVRKLTGNHLPEVGKHSSGDLLFNGAAPACVHHTTLAAVPPAAPKGKQRQPRSDLHRSAEGETQEAQVPAIVHDVLATPGEPLEPAAREPMEVQLGHDFSRVRLHTDARAGQSAQAVNAAAYTVGRHIVFGAGRFRPEQAAGRRLLAHELAHTIQQEHASVAGLRTIAPLDDAAEREAVGAEAKAEAPLSPDRRASLRRQPDPLAPTPSAPVSLEYVKEKPVHMRCGDYAWKIRWVLKGGTGQTNGFIVQKVKIVFLGEDCGDKRADTFDVYWEAWQVKGGKIMSGTSDKESLGDEFTSTGTMGTKGTQYHAGAAKFMENYAEPFTWGRSKHAGRLPATTTQPPGWGESGSKYRFVGVFDYACCGEPLEHGKLTIEELDV